MNARIFFGAAFLLAAMASATGCAAPVESGGAETDDSAEVKSTKVDSEILGVWAGDDGNQYEIFVLRKNGTYLRAFKGAEQSSSALADQREEGTFTAKDGEGVFTAKKVQEGRQAGTKKFSYRRVAASLGGAPGEVGELPPEGEEPEKTELEITRESAGSGFEGSSSVAKVFRADPTWCTTENKCKK